MGSPSGAVSRVSSVEEWVEHDERLDKLQGSEIRYRCRLCTNEFIGTDRREVVQEAEGHACLGPGVYVRVK